ncbi:MAG: hypothetical protein KAT70_06300, partial [Thermoplasmata archaeon]|nr:hypothetical protein [Thermoplasmata archaeon]
TLPKSKAVVDVSLKGGEGGVVVEVELEDSIPDLLWQEARLHTAISDVILLGGEGRTAIAHIKDSASNIAAMVLDSLFALDEVFSHMRSCRDMRSA